MTGSVQDTRFVMPEQLATLPEQVQLGIEAGLNYFELRFQGQLRFPKKVFAFFDCFVVRDEHPITRKIHHSVKWLTQQAAKLTYKCINQKTGLSMAFVVDDVFFHNRMMLAMNPSYMVYRYHTFQGMVQGSIIQQEIACVREVLQRRVKQFLAISLSGKIECADENERVVDNYIASKKRPNDRFQAIRKADRVIWETRPEILEIIRTYNGEYGWTNSSEFKQVYIQRINDLIRQRGISRDTQVPVQNITEEQVGAMLRNAIRGMSYDEIRTILKEKETEQAASGGSPEIGGIPATSEDVAPTGTENQNVGSEAEPTWLNKTYFLRLKFEKAREMAIEREIPGAESMKREELAMALYDDEQKRKSAWLMKSKNKIGSNALVDAINQKPENAVEGSTEGEELIAS
jgi:hypothetical protein